MNDMVHHVLDQLYTPSHAHIVILSRMYHELRNNDASGGAFVVRRVRRVRRDPILRLFHLEQSEVHLDADLLVEDDWPAPQHWKILVSFSSPRIAVDCLFDGPDDADPLPSLHLMLDDQVLKRVPWSERRWMAQALRDAVQS